MSNIEKSDAKNILEFLRGINKIHNYKFISKEQKELKEYYKGDIDSILRIKKELTKIKDQNMEKGKKYVINELIETLENWIKDLI